MKLSNMKSSERAEKKNKEEKVAIIGLDCNIGNANSPYEFWNRIQSGTDMVGTIPLRRKKIADDILNLYQHSSFQSEYEEMCYLEDIDKFDCDFFHITPREASLIDPSQKLLLQSVFRCLEDSNRKAEEFNGSSTGVFIGYDDGDLIRYKDIIYRAKPELYNMSIAGNHSAILAGRISDYFNLTGPAYNVNTACSSSLSALHQACKSILNEECTQAIVATVNLTLVPVKAENHQLGIESKQNRTRAFDYLSDGTAKGEGVITMLLKPYSKAVKEHDPIYAVVNKTAIGHDGKSSSLTSPNMLAQKRLIERAWKEAGLDINKLAYLEAHGTGTKIGDSIEIEALNQVMSDMTQRKDYCGIGSVKSNIGHLNSAAGLAGVLKVVLSLYYKEIVPTIHYTFPNWNLNFIQSPLYVVKKGHKLSTDEHLMAVNSFGLSGTNGHAIFSNDSVGKTEQISCEYYLLTISALNEESLKALIKEYIIFLNNQSDQDLFDICYTANTTREHYEYRKAFVFKNIENLRFQLLQVYAKPFDRKTKEKESCFGLPLKGILVEPKEADKNNLVRLATYYEEQGNVNWDDCYAPYSFSTVHIPVYSFKKRSCWWDYDKKDKEIKEPFCYIPRWELEVEPEEGNLGAFGDCLIVKSRDKLSERLATYLQTSIQTTSQNSSNVTVINYNQIDEIEWNNMRNSGITIFYLASLYEKLDYDKDYDQAVESGILAFHKIYLCLRSAEVKINQIICIGNYGAMVNENDTDINAFNSAFYEYLKSVSAEHKGKMTVKCIDVSDDLKEENITDLLSIKSGYEKVAVRGNKLYRETYVLDSGSEYENPFAEGDTYLVLGGFSENALHLCNRISQIVNVHFYFASRNPEHHLKDEAVKNMLALIRQNGSTYEIKSCDITVADEVKNLVKCVVVHDKKKIQGVIHCAGIESHGLLKAKTTEGMQKVIEPKIKGLLYLDRFTRQEEVKFYFCFSSLASVTGTAGQGDYAYANRFMDAYSMQMAQKGKRVISLDWPAFRDAGMGRRNPISTRDMLVEPLSFKKMSDWFVHALKKYNGHIIMTEKELFAEAQIAATVEKKTLVIEDLKDIKRGVIETWKEVLGYEEVDEEKDFIMQGGNSISAINLVASLEAKFPVHLPEDFYDSVPNIEEICRLIERQMNLKKQCVEVQGIKPFNQFMFNNCFYSALFSVLQKYEISIPDFILNFEPRCLQKRKSFQIEFVNKESLEVLLEKFNLELKEYDEKQNLIDCLKKAITSGNPVILGVDCYYISIREDMFKKIHYAHSVTVFGFDESTEEVIVMEQMNFESFSYQKRRISFEDISNAYFGYKENFPDKELDYVELYPSEERKGNSQNAKLVLWDYKQILNEIAGIFSLPTKGQKDEAIEVKILNETINFLEITRYLILELQEEKEKQDEIEMLLRSFQKLRIRFVRKKSNWKQVCADVLELI
ncbi:beta-ketoacyl synthase N-terminal-like domain-containing protein [Zhenhengia yiwuensis]|uniref:KR domain-containing protein n=1 Tax=Zhenhengia yiwuensis TaxID=2763666 RepID=A0A926EJJ4_9FIRM|nr:beta-ketoacyl synthase N-terminal-like domain-containing protein [Zhenhengia yiwuensis]MBC8580754.1 KR domain-containing protein [Zhenhengia yiwuensis]